MQKALTLGLAAAAFIAALSLHATGGAGAETAANSQASLTPYYVRGPRIIHVPQPGEWQEDPQGNTFERDDAPARASRRAARRPSDANDDFNDVGDVALPPPRRRASTSKHRSPPQKRRVRKPYSASAPAPSPPPPAPPPEPMGPRRAVLSAPPPHAAGMSPIYPTPRFEAKAEPAEKFTSPSNPLSTASVPSGDAPLPAPLDASQNTADQ